MPFGPELLAIRETVPDNKVGQISLGPFEPAEMPIFPSHDSAYRFLHPFEVKALRERAAHIEYLEGRISSPDSLIWGIGNEEKLYGYATLSVSDRDPELVYYGITLHPSARGLGIGSLATNAALNAVFAGSLLQRSNMWFADEIAAARTAIHPENIASQTVCQRAGFVRIEGEFIEIGGTNFYSYLTDSPANRPRTTVIPLT